jgi:hypothetical protein
MVTKQKSFDAVKTFRAIKEKISRDIANIIGLSIKRRSELHRRNPCFHFEQSAERLRMLEP